MDKISTANKVALPQIGATLRTLRAAAGLGGKILGGLTQTSQSKISKIENAMAFPTAQDLQLILAALNPDPMLTEQILRQFDSLDLPDGDFAKIITLGVAEKQKEFLERETRARSIRAVETSAIPGLLQIPDYAQALYEYFLPAGSDDISAAVR